MILLPALKDLRAVLIHEQLSVASSALLIGEGHWDVVAGGRRVDGLAQLAAQFVSGLVGALDDAVVLNALPLEAGEVNLECITSHDTTFKTYSFYRHIRSCTCTVIRLNHHP